MYTKSNKIYLLKDIISLPDESSVCSAGTIIDVKILNCQQDILVITVADSDCNTLEIHLDQKALSADFQDFDMSRNNLINKEFLFSGEIMYMNNQNICIYKNGEIYKKAG